MFVQVIQGHIADADELRGSMQRWLTELAPGAAGWLGSTGGVTADGTAITLVRFESAEAARRNSDRPEQHQWWMETSKLFAGDVTFHDCREVHEWGQGGSDRAGFVQVMQGRYLQPEKARDQLTRMEEPLRQLRPDVMGGLLCLHGDGAYTQAVYFTSEAEARVGEQRTPPPEVQSLWDEARSNEGEITYYDLTDPWLDSPR